MSYNNHKYYKRYTILLNQIIVNITKRLLTAFSSVIDLKKSEF